MSPLGWVAVLTLVVLVVMLFQLGTISARLALATNLLRSLDAELFRLAQEQNPRYGLCDSCGRRDIVSQVVPKGHVPEPDDVDKFYCKSCWWLSGEMQVHNEGKYYKDRFTERDRMAARVGPM